MITLSTLRAAAGRAGSLRRSPGQLRALADMHAARRGIRQRPRGLPTDLGRAVADLLREQPERGRISIRCAASAVGVSDRTLRRWLAGEDWPAPGAVSRLRRWLRSVA